MNPSKAWNAELEAGVFWACKKQYNQCEDTVLLACASTIVFDRDFTS